MTNEPAPTLRCPTCDRALPNTVINCPDDGTILLEAPGVGSIVFDRYEIVSVLGSGGVGTVYKALQPLLGTYVAIKTLQANKLSPVQIARFHREAKAVSGLRHPNLIKVTDFGVDSRGCPFMIMDYIDGMTLQDHFLERGALSVAEALDIFIQICDGMAHAHAAGVLHRDLKPSNIMLGGRSNDRRAYVVDFGIAKVEAQLDGAGLTHTGEVFGSPPYMSPEQARGEKLDQRSDIYSMGCLMYETLTGRPPFAGASALETLCMQINDAPPSLEKGSPGKAFPAALEDVVANALSKNPTRRYQSMQHLKKALESCRAGYEKGAISIGRPLLVKAMVLILLVLSTALIGFEFHQMLSTEVENSQNNVKQTVVEKEDLSIPLESEQTLIRQQLHNLLDQHVVYLSTSAVTDDDLDSIKPDADLRDVYINSTAITTLAIEKLKQYPLRTLDVFGTKIDDRGVREIGTLSLLEKLNINHLDNVHGGCFKALRQLSNLTELKASCNHVSKEDIMALANIPNLQFLDIADTVGVTDRSLEPLAKLKHLRTLVLNKNHLSSAACKSIGKMKELVDLDLCACGLDDKATQYLTGLKLTRINLCANEKLTDKSIDNMRKIKTLKEIWLRGCPNLTDKSIDTLKAQGVRVSLSIN